MTKGELFEMLCGVDDDIPVVFFRDDFPRDVERFELITAHRVGDHYHQEFYPELDLGDEAGITVLVLRERKGAQP